MAIPIAEISIIEWISIVFMVIVMIAILTLMIYMLITKFVRYTRYRVSLSLLFSLYIIDQLLIGKYIQYFSTNELLFIIHFVLGCLVFFMVGYCSTSVLSLYQSLIPVITPAKIRFIRGIMLLGFLLNIIAMFGKVITPDWNYAINGFLFLIYLFMIVIYDQIQNIYLVVKVYASLKSKHEKAKFFHRLMYLNVAMVILDFIAIACFIWASNIPQGSEQRIGFNISTGLQGVHGFVLLYLFVGMIELKFSERIAQQKNEKKAQKSSKKTMSKQGPETNFN